MSGPSLLVKLLSGDSPAPDVQNVTEASPSLLTAHLTWPIALPFLTLCLPLVAPAPQDCVCLFPLGSVFMPLVFSGWLPSTGMILFTPMFQFPLNIMSPKSMCLTQHHP